ASQSSIEAPTISSTATRLSSRPNRSARVPTPKRPMRLPMPMTPTSATAGASAIPASRAPAERCANGTNMGMPATISDTYIQRKLRVRRISRMVSPFGPAPLAGAPGGVDERGRGRGRGAGPPAAAGGGGAGAQPPAPQEPGLERPRGRRVVGADAGADAGAGAGGDHRERPGEARHEQARGDEQHAGD